MNFVSVPRTRIEFLPKGISISESLPVCRVVSQRVGSVSSPESSGAFTVLRSPNSSTAERIAETDSLRTSTTLQIEFLPPPCLRRRCNLSTRRRSRSPTEFVKLHSFVCVRGVLLPGRAGRVPVERKWNYEDFPRVQERGDNSCGGLTAVAV